jgi:ribosomal protein S18 acetylase RimI-like enzyme
MDEVELATAADANLAAAWTALGRGMGADVVEVGASALVASGLPLAFFNGAFVGAPAEDPEHLVAEAIRFFAERGLPWLLWVREGVSPATLAAGRAAGLRDAGGPPAMGLEPIPAPPTPPNELIVEIATTDEGLRDHASMLRDGFGMPQEFVDRLIRPQLLDEASIAAFVGRVEGTPVSCSLLAISDSTAGIYNVATPATFRGNGYGEALTWAALAEGVNRGCTNSILQASDSGYPIYRRMGFVDLGRYVQLEGPPRATAG